MVTPAVKLKPLSTYRPQAHNANRHTDRGMALLDSAMAQDGYVAPMTATADGEVIDGSARLEKATARFPDEALVIPHDGTRPIVMVRTDIPNADDPRAKRISVAANRIAQINLDFDPALLAEVSTEIDLSPLWTPEELREQLVSGDGAGPAFADVEPQIEKAEELREKWGVESGQLWRLGEHRLLCGDSTKREDVARVMAGEKFRLVWTDPPYGVSYGAKNEFLNAISRGNRIQTPIQNDQLSEGQTEDLCRQMLTLACEFGLSGASLYVACPAGTPLPHFIAAVATSGFQFKHSLVWVKNQFVIGRCDYHYKHEIILYGWKEGAHLWVGDRSQDSVFLVDKPHVSALHPTTKPIALIEPMLRNSSNGDDIVYDPFLGSGTTLIACEQLHRQCRAIEIRPGYVAVALERWHILTGKLPTLL